VDVVNNPELQQYIDRIGKRLASHPQAGGFPYEFTLINDDSINAFALPGGPIFVHTGLIEAAENEAQMAGVLAHEISHVALRHATNQASKAQLIQIPAVLAGAVIGTDTILAQLGQLGLGLGVNSLILRYSRDAETQSDALGARLMADAGYNPLEMARFFEKLEAEGGSSAPQFLSSRPNPGNRVKAVQAEIQTFPQKEYAAGNGDFRRAKTLVAGLPKPRPSRVQAASRPPAAPTGGFQSFQARTFALAYPTGWQVFGDQQSAVLTIAPREGLVQGNRGGIQLGYGAVVSYYRPQSANANLQSATEELAYQLMQVNPSMRAAGRPRRVTVGGQSALLTTFNSASPYGGAERDVLLTVARPEGLFYMMFVGPENAFGQLSQTFEQMLRSIRFA
jgi:predicted Zn-dependent protease